MEKINWHSFTTWGKEEEFLLTAFKSTWVSGGQYVDKFEEALKMKLNLPNALVVTNGTAALELALLGIDLTPGDEVIIPAYGFMAAANIVSLLHAKPIFIDVNPESWVIDHTKIESRISKKTKAIITIHNYGVVEDIDLIVNIAKDKNIILIEDCAESIFSTFKGKYCGNFGDISTFSFHATKTISTGEGGMVCCKDEKLYNKLKLIRSHGLNRNKKHYFHECIGNNYRMSNLLAAIGYAQILNSDLIIFEKKRVYERYLTNLCHIKGLKFQAFSNNSSPIIWAIAIYIDSSIYSIFRDQIILQLDVKGIECRPGFYTPDEFGIYDTDFDFLNARDIAQKIIVFPSFSKLPDEKIDYICKEFVKILQNEHN